MNERQHIYILYFIILLMLIGGFICGVELFNARSGDVIITNDTCVYPTVTIVNDMCTAPPLAQFVKPLGGRTGFS